MAKSYTRVALSRRVIVNLVTGNAIEGILWEEAGPLLVLRMATLHEKGADAPQPMDGDIVIERDRIEFLQAVA